MYEVFFPQSVIENLPLTITCLQNHEKRLYIGTSTGDILTYEIEEEPSFAINLLDVAKGFTKGGIRDMCILPRSKTLAVLTDSGIIVCDATTLKSPTTLPKTSGARDIISLPKIGPAIDVHHGEGNPNGEQQSHRDLFAFRVKKTLFVYEVTLAPYEIVKKVEKTIANTPQALLWSTSETLLVCTRMAVLELNITTGETRDLIDLSVLISHPSLNIPRSGGFKAMVGGKDSATWRMCLSGGDTGNGTVGGVLLLTYRQFCWKIIDGGVEGLFDWTSSPIGTVIFDNYYVALLDSTGPSSSTSSRTHLEIRSQKTHKLLQTISTSGKRISLEYGMIFVSDEHKVWRLLPLDFEDQIDHLVAANRFQDALNFIEELEFPSEEDKKLNLIKVKALYAYYMFNNGKKYDVAIQLLEEIQASPLDILELFPELLKSHDFAFVSDSVLTSPVEDDEPDELEEGPSEVERIRLLKDIDHFALQELSRYLVRERARLARYRQAFQQKTSQHNYESFGIGQDDLPVSPSYTGSCRPVPPPSPARFRIAQQGEKEILSMQEVTRLSEVVDLSLLKCYLSLESPLLSSLLRVENFCAVEETEVLLKAFEKWDNLVDFLRNKGLHKKALEFIATLALEDSVEKTVTYLQSLPFENHLPIIFEYSRPVFEHAPGSALQIFMGNLAPLSHDIKQSIVAFLDTFRDNIKIRYLEHLIFSMQDTTREFHNILVCFYLYEAVDPETNELGSEEVQTRLVDFLVASNFFDPLLVLDKLPKGVFLEERALLYSRLKRHEEALSIYVTQIQDISKARQYCERVYQKADHQDSQVFTILFELVMKHLSTQLQLKTNLGLLSSYGHLISPKKALPLLQGDLEIQRIHGYVTCCMNAANDELRKGLINCSLLETNHLQVQHKVHLSQQQKVTMTDEKMCSICLKRIASTIFTAIPGDGPAHAYCHARISES